MYATKGWKEVIQNMYMCVQGERVEKSVIRYVRTKWMVQTNVVKYFLCTGSAKYARASPPARKMSLFSSIIVTIIRIIYAIIRI